MCYYWRLLYDSCKHPLFRRLEAECYLQTLGGVCEQETDGEGWCERQKPCPPRQCRQYRQPRHHQHNQHPHGQYQHGQYGQNLCAVALPSTTHSYTRLGKCPRCRQRDIRIRQLKAEAGMKPIPRDDDDDDWPSKPPTHALLALAHELIQSVRRDLARLEMGTGLARRRARWMQMRYSDEGADGSGTSENGDESGGGEGESAEGSGEGSSLFL